MNKKIDTCENREDYWFKSWNYANKKAIDLQNRIDKAIEYINYNDDTLYTYEPDYDYEENIVDNYDVSSYRVDLLEILKGENNE